MKKGENNFHSISIEETLTLLKTKKQGLTSLQAKTLKAKYGPNEIPETKQTSHFIVFLRQFQSLMVYILIVAAIISLFLDRIIDAYVIGGVIIINALIGFFQESKAENAIKALKKMIVQKAKVYRNNELIQIPARDLVPGDVISLEEGDKIPADARLLEINDFRTIESSLTGESFPINKTLKIYLPKTQLADKKNMVFLGTFVAAGTARAVIVHTGSTTEIGKLAKSIQSVAPQKSHFKEKTDTLAKYMAIIATAGALLTFLVGYFFRDFEIAELFLVTIASLVSGIPEGLPAILAIVLAMGAFRMAKRNAIIRERYATETLNVVDTIITDKTGTLTQNTMTVQEIVLPGQDNVEVSGSGFKPEGKFTQKNKSIDPTRNSQLSTLLHIASYCNNSRLIKEQNAHVEYKILGDPTEAALLVLAEKAGIKNSSLVEKEEKLDEMPFNAELKYRASLSILSQKNNKKQIYVVGAPEAVINNSSSILINGRKAKLTSAHKASLEKRIDLLTNKAMRVLALAYKEAPSSLKDLKENDTNNLVLVGIVGMSDPPRKEVKLAIEKAKSAGIRIIMATGDHKNTAIAIAKQIGLVTSSSSNYPLALTGKELSDMTDKDFIKSINKVSIFARLTPELKLKIAKVLQSQGHVVAMTGDGVNDAPALKQADLGISMGKIGTDVARESSQIILADDNFASIVSAIEEGRVVFDNTRRTSFFLASTSVAEHATIISTIALGLPLPLLPTQILWLNIVTGGVTDMALATEPVHGDVLKRPPRNKKTNILDIQVIPFMILLTLTMLLLTVIAFNLYLPQGETKARTVAFTMMSFTQLFAMYNLRSMKNSLFSLGIFSNKYITGAFLLSFCLLLLAIYFPFLQSVFGFTILTLKEILILFTLSSLVLWIGEGYKLYKRRKAKQ